MTHDDESAGARRRADMLARLNDLGACADAVEWAATTKGTPAQLWARCRRADWMLWIAARASVDRRLVVLAACDCARTALPHVPPGEDRPLRAIETAERWAKRAIAAYAIGRREGDAKMILRAESYRREALEHASQVGDCGKTVCRLQRSIDKARRARG